MYASTSHVFLVVLKILSVSSEVEQLGNNLIKNESTYYTVIASTDSDYLCLMSSPNLFDWTRNRGIFDEFSAPLWAPSTMYKDPEIVMMGPEKVRVYFAAEDSRSTNMGVGVAFSTKLEADRRYSTLNRPLAYSSNASYVSPSLVLPANNSRATKSPLLLYVSANENAVYGALLTEDGLEIHETAVLLLKPTLPWEGDAITQVWGVARTTYYFIFYTGADEGVVGVARSVFPLGPYDKRGDAIARIAKSPLAKSTLMRNIRWQNGWPDLLF